VTGLSFNSRNGPPSADQFSVTKSKQTTTLWVSLTHLLLSYPFCWWRAYISSKITAGNDFRSWKSHSTLMHLSTIVGWAICFLNEPWRYTSLMLCT